MPKQKKIIGIAGGLGPYAHIDFERKLLESAQRLAGASADQDYPEWILSSVPQTPDRTLAIEGKAEDPVPYLLQSVQRLAGNASAPGADFAVVPCNTAHRFLDQVRAQVDIPILDMIALTADAAHRLDPKARVGILATTGTLKTRLYHDALAARGLKAFSPLDLEHGETAQRTLVMEPIYGKWADGQHQGGGIKSVGKARETSATLQEAAAALAKQFSANIILAACTEIPIALEGNKVAGVPLIDPTRILAEAAIREAYGLGDT